MINWKEHKELQHALQRYLSENNLALSGEETYESSIDCVFVVINNDPVFIIGVPPVSYYPVQETEYTDKYLRPTKAVAV